MKIELNNPQEVAKLIKETESGIHESENDKGEKLAIILQQGEEMEVMTYQQNGWIRRDFYDNIGLKTDELFAGRWN